MLHNVTKGRARLPMHAKFHLDPSNRLATILQRHRQDRQTGQDKLRDRQTDRQVADWTTRGIADAAKRTKTKHGKSPVASASCPVRDLSSTRVV